MIITVGNQRVNPDHIVRLGQKNGGWPFMAMSHGEDIVVHGVQTTEDLADKINSAIRREKQKGQGCHKEFTPFGLV